VSFAEKETVGMADVSRVVVPGPLGPFAAGSSTTCGGRGFRPVTVGKHVALLDLAIKERALARTKPLDSKPGRYRPPDALLRFLDGL
jgi:hypothetical protein